MTQSYIASLLLLVCTTGCVLDKENVGATITSGGSTTGETTGTAESSTSVTGTMSSGPMTSDSMTSDSMTSDPMTSYPMTSGTTTSGTTTSGTTTSGETSGDSTGGDVGACTLENFPPEGSGCDMEGQICSTGCEDPCQFCNFSICEGGTWQSIEVFPANCLDCDALCALVVPASCAKGPPTQAECVAGCQASESGKCMLPFNETRACVGNMPEPKFSCDDEGRPVADDCEAKFEAFYMCSGL